MPRKVNNKWNYRKTANTTNRSLNYTVVGKTGVLILAVVLLGFGLSKIKKPNIDLGNIFKISRPMVSSLKTSELNLPDSWKIINKEEGNKILFSQKMVEEGIVPTVLLEKISLPSNSSVETYVEKLKQGATAIIPKLSYTKTIKSSSGLWDKYEFSGNYVSRGNKIEITQILLKNGEDYYLYTMSHAKASISNDEVLAVNKSTVEWFTNK